MLLIQHLLLFFYIKNYNLFRYNSALTYGTVHLIVNNIKNQLIILPPLLIFILLVVKNVVKDF